MEFLSVLFEALKSVSLKDWMDITIFSLLISLIIYILLKLRNFNLFLGFFIFLSFYFSSLIFNFKLVKSFFENFSGILVLSLVIIFSKEIRAFLERLGLIFPRIKRFLLKNNISEIISEVLEALNHLSKTKTGALIVFENRMDLDNLITGGIEIDAKIKKELIISLFNKNSPLHDGALVIKNNKIKYASAHLPLAENYKFEKKLGTRHRAGVGITEKSDALSIIVSEESGHISLAKGGELFYNVEFFEIKNFLLPLLQSLENGFNLKSISSSFDLKKILRILLIFSFSFVLVLFYWLSTNFNQVKIQKIIEANLEFKNLGENLAVAKLNSNKIKIYLTGLEKDFFKFKNDQIRILIDLKDFGEGNYFLNLSKKEVVGLPENLEIIKFEPERISFKLEKINSE